MLTREQILAAAVPASEMVDVPEWGGEVRVRSMTAGERDAFLKDVLGETGRADPATYRPQLAARCIVDDAGAPLFTYAEVAAMDWRGLDRVFPVADRLNSVTREKVEAAVKN